MAETGSSKAKNEHYAERDNFDVPLCRAAIAFVGLVPKLSICDLRVLLALMNKCYEHNRKSIAVSTYVVSKHCGLTRLSVSRALRRLAAAKLIHAATQHGPNPTVYAVDIEAIEALGADELNQLYSTLELPVTTPVRKRQRRQRLSS